jgi:hypothetical protein
VRLGLERYLDVLRADPLREKAMLELTQYALRTPGLDELAQVQYARYVELASDALDTAAALWQMTWTTPVEELARLMVIVTDGVTMSWLVNRDDEAAGRAFDFAADAVVRQAVAA